MSRDILGTIVVVVLAVLIMFGCGYLVYKVFDRGGTTPEPTGNAIINPPLSLTKSAQPTTFSAPGQSITYSYLVSNSGTSSLPGPVTISDNKAVATCPNVNTVGNKNGNLDGGENITCTSTYVTTQDDFSNGGVTNTATATVGGQNSTQASFTVQATWNKVLSITTTPNTSTYSAAGQQIIYTYVVTNAGTAAIGPTQFWVKDDHVTTLIPCGANQTTLPPGQMVSCTGAYIVTTGDISQPQIVNNATATTPTGAGTIQPASATVRNSLVTPGPGTYAPLITPGSMVTHVVTPGDWLLQISRCYGASFPAVRTANPQVVDPDVIFPQAIVKVPNVGSVGTIYGPPCMIWYTVVSGNTWQSIANTYNADITILQAANPGVSLSPGVKIKVPVNSKGGPPVTVVPTTPIATVVIPTVTTPAPPTTIPLNFPAGSPSSISVPGNISTPGTIRYVFTGKAKQTLSVQLIVPTNDVSLAIYGPTSTLKAPDATSTYNGTLPVDGNYYIDLVSSVGNPSKTYTLNATLTTPASTTNAVRVADIYSGSGSSNPSYLSPFNAQLYFQANGNNGAGAELWKYDLGTNTPSMVVDIFPGANGSTPTSLRLYQNMLYFGANGNDGAGNELWRYNGSATGRVTDLFPGEGSSNPMYMTEFNGDLYFSANGNNGAGVELWKFNGSTSATAMAADINPGPGNSNPSYLVVYNNLLYFAATTTNGGTELWKFDGANATLASDITPGAGNANPAFLTVLGNLLYFSANGNNGAGTELWKYDGSSATMAADVNPGPADSAPTYLTPYNNSIYFGAVGNSSGFELWRFDGTTASMAADINPSGSSNPAYLSIYSNELYFQADGGDGAGAELWKYKGP
jgi:ELWxxDGT repeat protein